MMNQWKNRKLVTRIISVVLVIGFFVSVLILSTGNGNAVAQSADIQQIYLPLVVQKFPLARSIFGVEINRGSVSAVIDQAVDLKAPWVRYNGVQWHEVEPIQGNYDWSKLSTFESEMETLTSKGFSPIVIIRGTPEWARMARYPDSACSPVREDALDDFSKFVSEVVGRYKNVKYWELGNEPDIDPRLVTDGSVYGCWGDENDPYYGGGYYATMLKYVYPAIKQANPAAQVSIGGLLMDCDPTNPPAGKDCLPSKFLEGILRNGGGKYFDLVAYHAYSYWAGTNVGTDWDLTHLNWKHRGGALLGKLDFIMSVLKQYGFEDKSIIMNEGVLLCSDDFDLCRNDGFYHSQSNYAIRLYTRAKTTNLDGVLWYTLNGPGWRYGSLLDDSQQPRLVYRTYSFLVEWLAGADYQRQLANNASGLEGYAFLNPSTGRTYQIYWMNKNATQTITKPAKTIAVYDMFGNELTPSGGTISIGFSPIIIELAP